jgi:hypothetical protein
VTEAEQIARFLADKGATRCPPKFAAPSQIGQLEHPPGTIVIVPLLPQSNAQARRGRQIWSHHDLGTRRKRRSHP